eukprot:756413-Hanusia_phi.AAC.6
MMERGQCLEQGGNSGRIRCGWSGATNCQGEEVDDASWFCLLQQGAGNLMARKARLLRDGRGSWYKAGEGLGRTFPYYSPKGC